MLLADRGCARVFRGRLRRCCRRAALQASSAPGAAQTSAAEDDVPAPRTRRLLATLPVDPDAPGGAGGAGSWEALQRADASWAAMRGLAEPPPAGEFVRRLRGSRLPSGPPTFDVAVCGGTLGVVYAAALAATGLSVVVVERGRLAGRAQEWNVSASELQELVGAGVLTAFDAEACVTSRFGADGNRLGLFGHPGSTVAVRDVLNLGVSPAAVVAAARRALEAAGGSVAERTAVAGLSVHDDGVALDGTGITAQLVVDALGHGSPLVRQVRGSDRRPDGVCLVVGCCARGYDPAANAEGDVLVTTGNLEADGDLLRQTFWEAFPAGSGPADRTVYQFTYVDADPGRGSLTAMMERFWGQLGEYQGVDVERLQLLRVLFGAFPTYRDSPLRPAFDRVLHVGDASGIQSPLSFGGFGAACRHAGRVAAGVASALEPGCDATDAAALSLLSPYLPNLSGAWLFQRAMSAPRGTRPRPGFVNALLATNFRVMAAAGEGVLRPFLLDVPRLGGLSATLAGMVASNPGLVPRILAHVGPGPLLDWGGHFAALVLYTLLALASRPLLRPLLLARGAPLRGLLPPRARHTLARLVDAWEYGSGLDYAAPGHRGGGPGGK